jgi:hypothetical protein
LVEFCVVAAASDGFEHPHRAEGSDVSRVFGHVEADFHVALGGEVVDFIGFYVIEYVGYLFAV